MEVFLRWVLFISLLTVAAIILQVYSVYTQIYTGDVTKLSFVIMSIFIYSTYKLGLKSYVTGRAIEAKHVRQLEQLKIESESGWFSANICSRIGIVGTVWGFIIMGSALVGLDLGDPSASQEVMLNVYNGISVALYTTLVAQVCNILLSIQSFNLIKAIELELHHESN